MRIVKTSALISFYYNRRVDLGHQKEMKFYAGKLLRSKTLLIAVAAFFAFGCNIVKTDKKTPTLLKNENAGQQTLINEVNRFAKVNSMRAKMYLKLAARKFIAKRTARWSFRGPARYCSRFRYR